MIRIQKLIAQRPQEATPIELGELYRANAEHVRRIVRFSVRAPEAVIDDACQVAWSRLVGRGSHVRRERVLAWLVTTASREALRLVRHAGRELPLEALAQPRAIACAAPEQVVEFHERLEEIGALPRRQQRLVWLHAFGLSYAEMASYTGETERTIERQILRAKRALRRAEVTAPSGRSDARKGDRAERALNRAQV